MQFQQDWPKDKKITALEMFWLKTEKFRSTELYAPRERSTIFLYRSSTGRTPLNSSRLAELKYAFFRRTGRNNERLRRSNLFSLMIFKHGLLEGSVFFQYSSISRTKFQRSRLGEIKYAISAG